VHLRHQDQRAGARKVGNHSKSASSSCPEGRQCSKHGSAALRRAGAALALAGRRAVGLRSGALAALAGAVAAVGPRSRRCKETPAQLQFGPDGCALDAEGHIWAADEVRARCVRLAPGGQIVAPEGLDIFACMLGGDRPDAADVRGPDFAEQRRTANHEAVRLTATVDVPHAGLP
jgi:hypothetical protein